MLNRFRVGRGRVYEIIGFGQLLFVKPAPTAIWRGRVYEIIGLGQLLFVKPAPTAI